MIIRTTFVDQFFKASLLVGESMDRANLDLLVIANKDALGSNISKRLAETVSIIFGGTLKVRKEDNTVLSP